VTSSYGSDGPFAHLSNVEIGDMIFVHSFGQLYIYEIKSIKNVGSTDASVFKHEEKSWLTLVTCSNYDETTEVYQSRLIVRAVLVETRSDFSLAGR
jgi:LPXTG-site transpeptidase (sortase) family protein